jgi:hypothetical protein
MKLFFVVEAETGRLVPRSPYGSPRRVVTPYVRGSDAKAKRNRLNRGRATNDRYVVKQIEINLEDLVELTD